MKRTLPNSITNNLELPVIAAPMFLVSGPELVIASCENGIIGSFPLQNARTIEVLEDWLKQLTTTLSQLKADNPTKKIAPWAANLVVHRSYDRMDQELELVKKYQPPIVITALGNPGRVIEAVHSYGGLVFADVNSIPFAKKAAATGVDGLILVTSGAGGHTGMVNNFAFIEAVQEFWNGYIVLAGGMSTGQSIFATEALGADLAYMGTKFIVAEESNASQEYKEMLLRTNSEDIILTDAFTGVPANMIRESIEKAGYEVSKLKKKEKIDFEQPLNASKAWKDIWSAGHGVGHIKEIQPMATIIQTLKTEYDEARVALIGNKKLQEELL
ncbi:NAD(P)H-dependent flavin oxidoreductase [Solibacillus cecembensis]|uniref:NAD(P)H-dependent flavin oxidoreductase n=1 Tax=Solibacillus cecembensis TaxID=459347 RepID=UPI003D091038